MSTAVENENVNAWEPRCACEGSDGPYLALLDGVGGCLLQQLDGLVVVLGAAACHHVSQELHTVQLTIGVLGPRVVHKADLRPGEGERGRGGEREGEGERERERESWVRHRKRCHRVNDGEVGFVC